MNDLGSLLILRRKNQILSLLLHHNRLLKAHAKEACFNMVGDIFIGKVQNVVKNIDAAFVEIEKGVLCFLPLKNLINPLLTNRLYDGRLIAGDEVVVQLEKEAVKTKDAVVTTNLSFSGKYSVLTTGKVKLGYSNKLKERKKKEIDSYLNEVGIKEILNAGEMPLGLVIRTNADELTDYQVILTEIQQLLCECANVLTIYKHRTCFSKLKSAPPSYLADIRDTYSNTYEKIITDETVIYEELKAYLLKNQPNDLEKLTFYQDEKVSLSSLYGIEGKIKEALSKKVWLKSGGYLIIEPTEALTVIDVNTGKYSGNKKNDETFYYINQEACDEIAIQLTLRNISGIILVDFINMVEVAYQEKLMSYLSSLLQKDAIKTNVIDMTALGLVEITRKKVNKTLAEQWKE